MAIVVSNVISAPGPAFVRSLSINTSPVSVTALCSVTGPFVVRTSAAVVSVPKTSTPPAPAQTSAVAVSVVPFVAWIVTVSPAVIVCVAE